MPDYREELCRHAAARPEAVEDHPWGHTAFKVRGKLFAIFGDPVPGGPTVVTLKPAKDDLEALLMMDCVRLAAYVGRFGWVTVTVGDEAARDLALDLIEASWGQIAPRSLQAKGQR